MSSGPVWMIQPRPAVSGMRGRGSSPTTRRSVKSRVDALKPVSNRYLVGAPLRLGLSMPSLSIRSG